jgi:hypothetical protein
LAGDDAPTIADVACFPYVAMAPEGGFTEGGKHRVRAGELLWAAILGEDDVREAASTTHTAATGNRRA